MRPCPYYINKTGTNTVEMVDRAAEQVVHRADYGLKSWADCTRAGQHLKQIDRDGYCRVCMTRPFEEMAGPDSAKILRRQEDGD